MSLTLGLMAAQGIYGAAKSIIGQNDKMAAYSRQRKAAQQQTNMRNFQLQSNFGRQIEQIRESNKIAGAAYSAKVAQGKEQLSYNAEWLRDTFLKEQLDLNNYKDQLSFKDQFDEIRLAQSSGRAAAAGQSGATAARLDSIGEVQLGLNRAIYRKQLTGRIDAFDMKNEMLEKKVAHDAYLIGQSAAVLPSFGKIPDMPMMYDTPYVQKPSSTGMWMELGGIGLNMGLGMAGHISQVNRSNQLLEAIKA